MPSRLIIPGATAFSRFLLREAAEWVAKGGLDGGIGKRQATAQRMQLP
ncbi:hypothetical protein NLL38_02190 [Corynebacterium accolens]|nr:hypothetical protein [Corynebacterium accolens]EEI15557.1 hypothetical protein HMPREF0276_0172 [Corynebacterium accolens ATCC 49725]MDK4294766.1 hypothetical protein [Corynebacterium accolens]MDK8681248.1 hypothetical protein [Corynebacterium accolens]UQZ27644.1 hypothetical protein CACC_04650 [Corynebacterium accolens]WKS63218.1 hypothetical protein NLL39_03910 [Corynebacterium accolens]